MEINKALFSCYGCMDRGSLPSETLKCGSWKGGLLAGGARKNVFVGIHPCAHCAKVPLQVFSGETTPILRIGSPTATEVYRRELRRFVKHKGGGYGE